MASRDARATTIEDFGLESEVLAGDHAPELHPRERFVRCRSCGVTATHPVVAERPIRRALEELAAVPCDAGELPDVPVGDHLPSVAPARPGGRREVVCQSCGRRGPLGEDPARTLEELAAVPCIDALGAGELVDLVFAPTVFSPALADLGISNWTGVDATRHGEGVRRLFRHERFQYTIYVREAPEAEYSASLHPSRGAGGEPLAELRFPTDDPDHPVTRESAETLVTFLSATDPLTAGEFRQLVNVHETERTESREAWLEAAYETGRERFRDRFSDTPEAFTTAFEGIEGDEKEVIRRLVGSGGFEDPGEEAFARETLGHDHEFPGLFRFAAQRHGWSPPVADH